MQQDKIVKRKLVPVLLAGGIGSRLWPLSREHYPKQLLSLLGDDSLLQATLKRILAYEDVEQFIVICNEKNRYQVLTQIEQINPPCKFSIILEPEGRNTAPAAALAALYLSDDVNILFMPADHLLQPEVEFLKYIKLANRIAADNLITFGVSPAYAEPGYGYIETKKKLPSGAYQIKRFVEKPSKETAGKFIEQGSYYWNSGIFLFPRLLFLEELKLIANDIYVQVEKATKKFSIDGCFVRFDNKKFLQVADKSLDYALLEHTKKGLMLPINLQWSDVGSWQALYEYEEKDKQANVIRGDVVSIENQDCYLYSDSHLLAAIGLKNIIAVQTADCVLIVDKNESQKVKEIVEDLQVNGRTEAQQHLTTYHPWGTSMLINYGTGFRINRVDILPHQQLSLHQHQLRNEHWIVLAGTAVVIIGAEETKYEKDTSFFISATVKHSIINCDNTTLSLLEVQSGKALETEDIIRYD